jgi:membrane protein
MMRDVDSYHAWLRRALWETDLNKYSRLQRLAVRLGRVMDGIIRAFGDGHLNLRIMGLAYTTLLSLIPLLAVSFSVLKAFEVQQQLDPLLLQFLAPLGSQGQEIHDRILSFVSNLQVRVLGSVGFAMLFYTVVSLLTNIERAFNDIWQVSGGRSLARRFSDYLSVILIGPVLIFTALGFTHTALGSDLIQRLTANEPLSVLWEWSRQLGFYCLISGAFAFLYGFLPNTRVRVGPALCGGFVAGLLWFTISRLFATFVVTSSNYSAIYSGFAGAVLFIIWVHVNWTIIVVGAQISAYLQNPHLLKPEHHRTAPDNRWYEQLTLEIMTLIGSSYYYNKPFWTLDALQTHYPDFQAEAVAGVVNKLERQRLIVANRDEPPAYLPARASENISLANVLAVVRGEGKKAQLLAVTEVMEQLDAALDQALQKRTLRDLIRETEQPPVTWNTP